MNDVAFGHKWVDMAEKFEAEAMAKVTKINEEIATLKDINDKLDELLKRERYSKNQTRPQRGL